MFGSMEIEVGFTDKIGAATGVEQGGHGFANANKATLLVLKVDVVGDVGKQRIQQVLFLLQIASHLLVFASALFELFLGGL